MSQVNPNEINTTQLRKALDNSSTIRIINNYTGTEIGYIRSDSGIYGAFIDNKYTGKKGLNLKMDISTFLRTIQKGYYSVELFNDAQERIELS